MNLVDVISSDVSRVADNVIAALEDEKINWQDTDEAFRIIGSLSDITKKWKDMKDEVTDIDFKEAEILIATLLFEYKKLKGKIENV
jgi:regulator of sigma D